MTGATSSPDHTTGLTVRKLQLDLSGGFARHWHGGDAFLSQYYNALSMSFPVGEQSFIDAVREGLTLLPAASDAADAYRHALLRETAAQFVGQEATHRYIHGLYNAELGKQGLINHWQHWATKRLAFAREKGIKPRHLLAVTAAYEHLTAVLADHVLRDESVLAGADERMQLLWRWHAAEETEHRAVAFDVYTAVGGNHFWRIRWYVYVLMVFSFDAARQTASNLWRDGSFFNPRTWWSAAKFFWGKSGLVWHTTRPLLAYFRRDFYPDQEASKVPADHASSLAKKWLSEHAKNFRVVR